MFYVFHGDDGFTRSEQVDQLRERMGEPEIAALNTAVLDGRTLTWEELTGWIRPTSETQDLVKDATVTFTGDYIENSGTGTIIVTAAPDYLAPPWILHGPDGLLLGGAGNKTLPAMTAGEYTLVWENLSGWVAPEPGMTPRFTSGCPKLARSLAIRISHTRATSVPPPNAYPLMAAMTGFSMRSMQVIASWLWKPSHCSNVLSFNS